MTLYLVLNFTHTINRTVKDSLLISKKVEGHQLSNSLKTRKQINTKAGTDQWEQDMTVLLGSVQRSPVRFAHQPNLSVQQAKPRDVHKGRDSFL